MELAPEVRDFVLSCAETQAFVERMNALLDFTLPNYEREGKSNLTLAFRLYRRQAQVGGAGRAKSRGGSTRHRGGFS